MTARDDARAALVEGELMAEMGTYVSWTEVRNLHKVIRALLDEPVPNNPRIEAAALRSAAHRILEARRDNWGYPDAKAVDPNGDASVWLFNEAARIESSQPSPEPPVFERAHDYSGGVGRCRACGVTRREGTDLKCPPRSKSSHVHESWQIRVSAQGGLYCAACGQDVSDYPDGSGS